MYIERIIIWIALGFFICFKRDWYKQDESEDMPLELICFFAIVFMPINFCIVFYKRFFHEKWNN